MATDYQPAPITRDDAYTVMLGLLDEAKHRGMDLKTTTRFLLIFMESHTILRDGRNAHA